jgi:SAM-dependent methyltransferase
VCGGPTEPLYRGAVDHYFGTGLSADYVICADRACRTVAQVPLPPPEQITRFYEGYYTHAPVSRAKRLERSAGARLLALRHRHHRRADACVALPDEVLRTGDVVLDLAGIVPRGPATRGRGPRVLDVGCGNGENLAMLASFGYETACGVEYDERACAAARSLGFEVKAGSAEAIPYPDGAFDVVFLRHVIEHVLEPEEAFAELRRVLRPGGLVSLLTPNAASRMHERYGRFWRGLEPPRHLRVLTPPSLAALVAAAGFEVLRCGSNDRSARWMERLSRACADEHGRGAPAERLPELAPSLSRGEELYLVARRPS